MAPNKKRQYLYIKLFFKFCIYRHLGIENMTPSGKDDETNIYDIRMGILLREGCANCCSPFRGGDYYQYSKKDKNSPRVHFICQNCQNKLTEIGVLSQNQNLTFSLTVGFLIAFIFLVAFYYLIS